MKRKSCIWKYVLGIAMAGMLAVSIIPAIPSVRVSAGSTDLPTIKKAGTVPASDDTRTYGEPFAPDTGGSRNFRIPALITMQDGTLVAAADARYGTTSDGGGLDTIASVSKDNGKTWNYSFPLYFPDSEGITGRSATTIIDPGLLEGPDGRVYCFIDVNPTGSTTLFKTIGTGTGYVTVGDKRYLAVTDDYNKVETEPKDDNLTDYPYYVGDFDEEGFAPILKRADSTATDYGVDQWYNLYSYKNGKYVDDLRQKQVNAGSTTDIQQNIFYQGSNLHVYSIGYIWMVTSDDGGLTWNPPKDINDQVKRHEKEHAILVSPGKGITTRSGDIILGFYDSQDGQENARLAYSSDCGDTWKYTNDVSGGSATSENEIVELDDGTLRMFCRNLQGYIVYADAKKDKNGEYVMGDAVRTDIAVTSTCNVTAIKYSKKINGKQAIMVGCPGSGSGRNDGKIYTFLVNDQDNRMEHVATYEVPGAKGGYCYSCLAELDNGDIGLLWEPNTSNPFEIWYDELSVVDIYPSADTYGLVKNVDLAIDGKETYTRTFKNENTGNVTLQPDPEVATLDISESGDGEHVLTISAVEEGFTIAVVDGVRYRIAVSDSAKNMVVPKGTTKSLDKVVSYTQPEDTSIAEVVVEQSKAGLFDHVSGRASSLESFSDTINDSLNLSNAEFEITKQSSGTEAYQIKNTSTNQYFANDGNATTVFKANAVSTVLHKEEINGKTYFRIANGTTYATNSRHFIFYFNGMNFNANGSYTENYTQGSHDFTLLEKQDSPSAGDIIPGYKWANDITSGKSYLITYIWENERVMVLYPVNGQDNMTKLYETQMKLQIKANKVGKTRMTMEGVPYNIVVVESECSHPEFKMRNVMDTDCEYAGYTGDKICANCGEIIEEGEEIPATGHAWDEGTITQQVTDTEDGVITYHCKNDGFHTKTMVVYASAYGPLQDEYEKATGLLENFGLYTDETVRSLQNAVNIYKEIVESQAGYRSEMLRGAEVLAAESASLKMKTGDELNSELGGALQDAGGIKDLGQGGYSDDAWNSFLEAYRKAEEGQKNAGTDPEALWEALKPLKNAVDALKKQEQEIQAAVAELEKELNSSASFYQNGKGKYEEPGWSEFVKAYEDAKNLSKNTDAETLKALMLKLESARKALKPAIAAPPEQNQDTPKAGDMVTVKNVQYKVLDPAKKTAAAFKGSKKTLAKVTIQATVNIKGVTCTVTEISTNAFKGYKKLTNVTIGKNVETIGKNAFNGCKKLKKVTFKGTAVKKIKSGAFKKTSAKMTVKLPRKMSKKQRAALLKKLKKAGVSKKAKIK